jgi:hypothetical protein
LTRGFPPFPLGKFGFSGESNVTLPASSVPKTNWLKLKRILATIGGICQRWQIAA